VPLARGQRARFNRVLRALVGLAAASCAFVMGLAVYAQGGC